MKSNPQQKIFVRILRSAMRVNGTVLLIVFTAYWWNPQKIYYPRKPIPNPNPKIDPDSQQLFSKNARVTVVAAHPDDPEFYISGTLLKLYEAKAKIKLIVVTDGDKGYYPPFTTNVDENRRVRRLEQIEAAKAYGAEVVFLGGPDGRYSPDEPNLKDKLRSALINSRPDYIFAFESTYLPLVQHRDHANTGKATLELAGSTNARWLLLYATTADNYYVDTSGLWEKRERLLAIHKSQFYGEKLEQIKLMVQSRAFEDGEVIGTEMAEGFRAVKLH
jgi:LmbE family N-acetylglucosaminyl deacetylase